MRIAIDARIIMSDFKGGVLVYAERLIEYIARIDKINKYFLLFSGVRLHPHTIPLSVDNNFKKVVMSVPDRKFFAKKLIWNNFVLPFFFRRENVDLFHLPNGHQLAEYKDIRKVITVHDLRSLHINDGMPQDLASLRRSCEISDLIIAVSEYTRLDIIKNFKIEPKKIKTIHNGVDSIFRKIEEETTTVRIKEKYNIIKPFFFCLGLVPRKNIKRLLFAYAKCKYKNDFGLVLAGSVANGLYKEEYEEIIRQHKLKNVHLLREVSQEELVLFYNTAFAFVFPSLYEGFGIPVLEAMACGTPTITSNISALPEIAADAALYVDPYDVEDIANAMEKIVEDKELRQVLIAKGFKRTKEFSWEKMAKNTMEAYCSIH